MSERRWLWNRAETRFESGDRRIYRNRAEDGGWTVRPDLEGNSPRRWFANVEDAMDHVASGDDSK